jgi:hypothetical protein
MTKGVAFGHPFCLCADVNRLTAYQRPLRPPRPPEYPPSLEDRWAEKQSEQYTGLSPLGWKGTWVSLPHWAHTAGNISRSRRS